MFVRLAAVLLTGAVAVIINGAIIIPALATGAEGITTFTGSSSGPIAAAINNGNGVAVSGTASNQGIAVQGAIGAGKTGIGVRGVTYGPGSVAVLGQANGPSNSSGIGVEGFSVTGYGVYAKTQGNGSALYAQNVFPIGGSAVQGVAAGSAIVGTTSGGCGSCFAAGVSGLDLSFANNGVSGIGGTGVVGLTGGASQTESGDGVVGISVSTNGVFGRSTSSIGVRGESTSLQGVFGFSAHAAGVYGESLLGNAVVAQNNATPRPSPGPGCCFDIAALFVEADGGGPLIVARSTVSASTSDKMSLDGSGNMVLAGTLTQSGSPLVVRRASSGRILGTYSAQQSQPTMEDFGQGQLVNGQAYVPLEQRFAATIDPRAHYLVFLTPYGDNHGLYVAQQTSAFFLVRESQGGRSTLSFDYRIIAKPYDTNAPRLPLASTLPHPRSVALPPLIRSRLPLRTVPHK